MIRINKLYDPYFVSLIIFQAIVITISVIGYPFIKGPISGGDYSIQYYRVNFPSKYLLTINLYSILQWIMFQVFGITIAQNALFLIISILPAFGIYFLALQLSDNRFTALLSALFIGTVLNPIIAGDLGGGVEYFLFFFFIYLSLGFIVRASKSHNYTLKYYMYAGVFWGLSITSNGFFPVGVYLSGPLILATILVSSTWSKKNLKMPYLYSITSFVVPAFIIMIALVLTQIQGNFGSLAQSSSKLSPLISYIIATIRFESKGYTIQYALLNGVYNGTFFQTSIFWYFLVLLSLFSGFVSLLKKGLLESYIKCAFVIYLFFASLIILYHYNIYYFVINTRLFLDLDYPQFFIISEQFSLVFLFTYFISNLYILNFSNEIRQTAIKKNSNEIPAKFKLESTNRRIRSIYISLRNKTNMIERYSALVFVFLLIVSSSPTVFTHLPSYYPSESNIPGEEYQLVGNWILTHTSNDSYQVLVLPNSYNTLNKIGGYISPSLIWNPPIPLPQPGGFNLSLYCLLFNGLYENNMAAVSSILATSGVAYIVLIGPPRNIELIPGGQEYNSSSTIYQNYNVIVDNFLSSGFFKVALNISDAYIFTDTDYFNLTSRPFNLIDASSNSSLNSSHIVEKFNKTTTHGYTTNNLTYYNSYVIINSSNYAYWMFDPSLNCSSENFLLSSFCFFNLNYDLPSGLELSLTAYLDFNGGTLLFTNFAYNMGHLNGNGTLHYLLSFPNNVTRINVIAGLAEENDTSSFGKIYYPYICETNKAKVITAKNSNILISDLSLKGIISKNTYLLNQFKVNALNSSILVNNSYRFYITPNLSPYSFNQSYYNLNSSNYLNDIKSIFRGKSILIVFLNSNSSGNITITWNNESATERTTYFICNSSIFSVPIYLNNKTNFDMFTRLLVYGIGLLFPPSHDSLVNKLLVTMPDPSILGEILLSVNGTTLVKFYGVSLNGKKFNPVSLTPIVSLVIVIAILSKPQFILSLSNAIRKKIKR
jgi:hypothetical protein